MHSTRADNYDTEKYIVLSHLNFPQCFLFYNSKRVLHCQGNILPAFAALKYHKLKILNGQRGIGFFLTFYSKQIIFSSLCLYEADTFALWLAVDDVNRATYLYLSRTGWWLQGGRHHGWHWRTEQPWFPDLWTPPGTHRENQHTQHITTGAWHKIKREKCSDPWVINRINMQPKYVKKVKSDQTINGSSPLTQGLTGGRGWTAPHRQRACCCDKLRRRGSGPPKSSWRWQKCQWGP